MNAWRVWGRRALAVVAVIVGLYAIKLPPTHQKPAGERPLRAVLFVNGTLGDKSFFDSAARGLAAARTQLGLRTQVVEAGLDPTRWESALIDVAESGDFDVVVTGGFAMVALVQRVAPMNPTTRFVVFDAEVDRSRCRCENVHAMVFRQNEGSYLAGVLAARQSRPQDTRPAAFGVVGAMQIPVIDDFIIGFTAGVHSVQPQAQVMRQYVNSFTDPATGKEIAKALYGRGAALVFHAAAGSGQGVIEAAAEAGRWAIGVDSDQYAIYKVSNPRQARHIVSSVLKNVDVAVLSALRRARDGQLTFGGSESLGVAEGGVSLAMGSEALGHLPPDDLAALAEARRRVASGEIRVPSAFAATVAGTAATTAK